MSRLEFTVIISGESRKVMADNVVDAAEIGVEDYEFRHAEFPVAAGTDDAYVSVVTKSGEIHNFVVTGRMVPLYTVKEKSDG